MSLVRTLLMAAFGSTSGDVTLGRRRVPRQRRSRRDLVLNDNEKGLRVDVGRVTASHVASRNRPRAYEDVECALATRTLALSCRRCRSSSYIEIPVLVEYWKAIEGGKREFG
ncbi:hypothetical protein B0H13DRAFT_2014826 [Mycena leptocephala]|nr:hypothetical protein B0H13DRAFT_2014826 [Mycena leptocephala]